jgi:hypothetical protein
VHPPLLSAQDSGGPESPLLPLPGPANDFEVPDAMPALPAETGAQPNGESAQDPEPCRPRWSDVPPVRPLPRPGNFTAPPTGRGYYSLLDELTHNRRDRPPPFPYPPFGLMPPSFFDADFRYVDDPEIGPQHRADCLKRIRCHNEDWLFATGGQVWWRYMNEKNSRLTGLDNDYHLYRSRVFLDAWHRDDFRVFVEFLDARVFGADLPPLPIDANHAGFSGSGFCNGTNSTAGYAQFTVTRQMPNTSSVARLPRGGQSR